MDSGRPVTHPAKPLLRAVTATISIPHPHAGNNAFELAMPHTESNSGHTRCCIPISVTGTLHPGVQATYFRTLQHALSALSTCACAAQGPDQLTNRLVLRGRGRARVVAAAACLIADHPAAGPATAEKLRPQARVWWFTGH